MKKILVLIGTLFLGIVSFPLEIKNGKIIDDYGNSIPAKEYKKIIVTDPGAIEILCEIEAEKSIQAIGKTFKSEIYPKGKTDKLEVIGDIVNLNIEKVVKYKPDLIIVNPMMIKASQALKHLKYDVVVTGPSDFKGILNTIEALGLISGKVKNAKKLKNKSFKKLEKIKEYSKKLKGIKGIIIYSASPLSAYNENSLAGEVLKYLGVINIAQNIKGKRPILSGKFILKENPDFIACSISLRNPNQILEANNIIELTKAGKENNIFILEAPLMMRNTFRVFDETEKLRKNLEKLAK